MINFEIATSATCNNDLNIGDVDFFIAGLNAESRSLYITIHLKSNIGNKICLIDCSEDNLSLDNKNASIFQGLGFSLLPIKATPSVEEALLASFNLFHQNHPDSDSVRIAVDISCLNRTVMAALLSSIRQTKFKKIHLNIFYSLASYTEVSFETGSNDLVKPIHPDFSGWGVDASKPVGTIVGLGYELYKALGAVEYLQSDNYWIFKPDSPETQYGLKVLDHNEELIEATPENRQFSYKVLNPLETLISLESLVAGLKDTFKPILLPFGPKIFFFISLLVATLHPEAAVWDVSGVDEHAKIDKQSSNHFTCLSLTINNNCDNEII